jgi:hypothetical protein
MTERLRLALKVCALILAIGAALFAANSPSFGLDNKAVYQGF